MSRTESAVMSLLAATLFGLVASGVSTWLFRSYGIMLFLGLADLKTKS